MISRRIKPLGILRLTGVLNQPFDIETNLTGAIVNHPIEFGTDGVRGQAGHWPISTAGALLLGQGLGQYLNGNSENPAVIIGRDTRESGAALEAALSAGLLSVGVDVASLGVMTTAGVAYLSRAHGFDAAVIISASHNPWQENGIKVMGGDGFKLDEAAERAMEAAIHRVMESRPEMEGPFGKLAHYPEWAEEYIHFLVNSFPVAALKGLRVVLDPGHGAASALCAPVFERLGAQVTLLNAAPDGRNINAGVGSEAVRSGKARLYDLARHPGFDIGVAFDGDSDRAVFVDETGAMLDGDHTLYILGAHLKQAGHLPGDQVVGTIMANSGLIDALAPLGLGLIKTKVGDKYIVEEMRANGYILGGEQSGHIVIWEDINHSTGDGIYTALYLASILAANRPQTLSQLAAPVIKYPQVVATARVGEKKPLQEIIGLEPALSEATRTLGEGVTMNVRYSGTESAVRVMIEGRAGHSVSEVAQVALSICRAVQAETGQPQAAVDIKDTTTGNPVQIDGL